MPTKISARLSQLLLILCLVAISVQPARAQLEADPALVIANAITYLKTQQQPDGGMTGFSGASDPDTTIRTVLALVLSDEDLAGFSSSQGSSLIDYLAAQAAGYVHDPNGLLFPGRAGMLLAAAALARQDVHAFGGFDLAGELAACSQPESGAYATAAALDYSSGAASDLNQAWAILGLALAGQYVPTPATFYLVGTQAEDGSWAGGDPDTTALAVSALLASRNVPRNDPMIDRALAFFKSTQLPNGGWKPAWDQDPLNADTTGWVARALLDAEQSLFDQTWAAAEGTPITALHSLARQDGSLGGTYVNAYSTADALIGLSQIALRGFALPPDHQRAALLVQTGDQTLFTACIPFTEESLTGIQLLTRAPLEVATVTDPSLGTAVCGIGADGCPSSDCFCGMPDYWSYWQQVNGGWAYAVEGAEHSRVVDGAIEAWSWGAGAPPALLSFAQVCSPGSIQPASLAVWPSVTPTAYPEPLAPTEPAPAVQQSYPLPAPSQAAPAADYPQPEPSSQAAPAPAAQPSFLPYALLGLLLVVLLIAIFRFTRRQS